MMLPPGHPPRPRLRTILAAVLVAASLASCGYGSIRALDQETATTWAELIRETQRQAEIAPRLVELVRQHGAASPELTQQVIAAQTRANVLGVTPDLLGRPEGLIGFQAAQSEFAAVLNRLAETADAHPKLHADAAYRELRNQLAGSQTRLEASRNRYIKLVQDYNFAVRSFPGNLTAMVLGFAPRPNFALAEPRDSQQRASR